MKNENKTKNKLGAGVTAVISAGVFAIIIGGTSHVVNIRKENNFTRVVSENGDYELEGFISYDNLVEHDVIEIETITGEKKLYIAKVNRIVNLFEECYEYFDIYSDKIIGIDTSVIEKDTVISAVDIKGFLVAYDMIKEKYSEDDIDYLLNRVKDDYQNNKVLKLNKEIY